MKKRSSLISSPLAKNLFFPKSASFSVNGGSNPQRLSRVFRPQVIDRNLPDLLQGAEAGVFCSSKDCVAATKSLTKDSNSQLIFPGPLMSNSRGPKNPTPNQKCLISMHLVLNRLQCCLLHSPKKIHPSL